MLAIVGNRESQPSILNISLMLAFAIILPLVKFQTSFSVHAVVWLSYLGTFRGISFRKFKSCFHSTINISFAVFIRTLLVNERKKIFTILLKFSFKSLIVPLWIVFINKYHKFQKKKLIIILNIFWGAYSFSKASPSYMSFCCYVCLLICIVNRSKDTVWQRTLCYFFRIEWPFSLGSFVLLVKY